MLQLKAKREEQSSVKIDWDDIDDLADSPESNFDESNAPSPPTTWLEDPYMATYGSAPLQPSVPIVRCSDCDKPILASALGVHRGNCKKVKDMASKKDAKAVTGNKRKTEEDNGAELSLGPPKKKGKKDTAPKGGKRIRGPAQLDQHCCVINDKGQPCSRSIACKVHSMVAKRAVLGRSKPYDALLLDYKRENVPGFVEPVKRETKAERKAKKEAEKETKRLELLAAGIVPGAKKVKAPKGEGKKNRKAEKATAGDKAAKKSSKPSNTSNPDVEDGDDDYDSEIEFDSLVRAVRAARPFTAVPLAQPVHSSNFFVARNEILRNCYDTMSFALSGGNIRGPGMSMVSA